MLSGYKTYIMVAVIAANAVAEGLLGIDVPGVEMQAHWLEWVMAALTGGALRSAIK